MSLCFVYQNQGAILEMRRQNMQWTEIARALDYPGKVSALSCAWNKHCRRNNIERVKPIAAECITEEMVKDCVRNKLTFSQMVLRYGFHFSAWRRAFEKYGYPFPKRQKRKVAIDKDRIAELIQKDLNNSEIAVLCDCSLTTVAQVRSEMDKGKDPELMPLSAHVPHEVRRIVMGRWV